MKIYDNPSKFPYGILMLNILEECGASPEKIATTAVGLVTSDPSDCPFTNPKMMIDWAVKGMPPMTFLNLLRSLCGDKGLKVALPDANNLAGTIYTIGAVCSIIPGLSTTRLMTEGFWRILRNGLIIDVSPSDIAVIVRKRPVEHVISEAIEDITDIRESGYWPYESPAPCSTEVAIKENLGSAAARLEAALEAHRSLRRGKACSGAPSTGFEPLK